jgi:hypothetical protein
MNIGGGNLTYQVAVQPFDGWWKPGSRPRNERPNNCNSPGGLNAAGMSRGNHRFKQGDVTKAIKGAVAAGLTVKRVEIEENGKIVIYAGSPDDPPPENEWDRVK